MPWTTEQKMFIVEAYFRHKSIHAAQLQFKERFRYREFHVLMLMKIMCWCWSSVGSWITFAFFLNKTFCWFNYVCNKTLACKISAKFHRLTKMSRDQNDQYQKGPWSKRLRMNRPDRNFLFRFQSCYVLAKFFQFLDEGWWVRVGCCNGSRYKTLVEKYWFSATVNSVQQRQEQSFRNVWGRPLSQRKGSHLARKFACSWFHLLPLWWLFFSFVYQKMLRVYMLEKREDHFLFFLVIHEKYLMKRFSVKMDAF